MVLFIEDVLNDIVAIGCAPMIPMITFIGVERGNRGEDKFYQKDKQTDDVQNITQYVNRMLLSCPLSTVSEKIRNDTEALVSSRDARNENEDLELYNKDKELSSIKP